MEVYRRETIRVKSLSVRISIFVGLIVFTFSSVALARTANNSRVKNNEYQISRNNQFWKSYEIALKQINPVISSKGIYATVITSQLVARDSATTTGFADWKSSTKKCLVSLQSRDRNKKCEAVRKQFSDIYTQYANDSARLVNAKELAQILLAELAYKIENHLPENNRDETTNENEVGIIIGGVSVSAGVLQGWNEIGFGTSAPVDCSILGATAPSFGSAGSGAGGGNAPVDPQPHQAMALMLGSTGSGAGFGSNTGALSGGVASASNQCPIDFSKTGGGASQDGAGDSNDNKNGKGESNTTEPNNNTAEDDEYKSFPDTGADTDTSASATGDSRKDPTFTLSFGGDGKSGGFGMKGGPSGIGGVNINPSGDNIWAQGTHIKIGKTDIGIGEFLIASSVNSADPTHGKGKSGVGGGIGIGGTFRPAPDSEESLGSACGGDNGKAFFDSCLAGNQADANLAAFEACDFKVETKLKPLILPSDTGTDQGCGGNGAMVMKRSPIYFTDPSPIDNGEVAPTAGDPCMPDPLTGLPRDPANCKYGGGVNPLSAFGE